MRRRIFQWGKDTQDRRLEAELAAALANVLAAVARASLRYFLNTRDVALPSPLDQNAALSLGF